MMHLMPFICHVFITAAVIFYVIFSPSSGNGCHCPLFTSGTSGTLYVRPARMEMGGATVKGSFSRWYLGLSVVAYSQSSAARLSVIYRCLFLAVRNIPTLLYIKFYFCSHALTRKIGENFQPQAIQYLWRGYVTNFMILDN